MTFGFANVQYPVHGDYQKIGTSLQLVDLPCPMTTEKRGGRVKKNSWYRRTAFFFGGYLRRRWGGGVRKKFTKIFSGPQNLNFPQLYPTSLGLEGARRIIFKLTIDVSANMGGICVSGHKDPRSVLTAVQRPPWPLMGRPKNGRKCYITPAFSGVPNKGDKIKAQKSNKTQK